jgi:hypothetical protein
MAVALACVLGIGAIFAVHSCAGTDDRATTSTAHTSPQAATADSSPQGPASARRRQTQAPESPPAADTPGPDADPAGGPARDDTTGFSIEVVDESGARVPGVMVRLRLEDAGGCDPGGVETIERLTGRDLRRSKPEPVTVRGFQKHVDGICLEVRGTADGFPALEAVDFTLHAGRVETVRLVAVKPRTAMVDVVDGKTGDPVAGARVVSTTEAERREHVDLPPPTPAVTGPDGRCVVEGMGAGEHELEINEDHHDRGRATWTGGDVRVALDPHRGSGSALVRVVGPDGSPVPNIRVNLVGTDRVVTTDAAGRAVFANVGSGLAMLSIDGDDWDAAAESGNWSREDYSRGAADYLADGGTLEFVLGVKPAGTGSIDARLVADDGTPIAHAEFEVLHSSRDFASVTDDAGQARFTGLPSGRYGARTSVSDRASWYLSDVALGDGERATHTWTLGRHVIRGRVVAGPDHHGVADVTVWFHGAPSGVVDSDADGRFELPRARAGRYEVDAATTTAAAVERIVSVPANDEIVVELIDYGRVVVRFAVADRPLLRTAVVRLCTGDVFDTGSRLDPGSGEDDFVDPEVLPGRYEVDVELGEKSKRFPVEVKSRETSVVDVRDF